MCSACAAALGKGVSVWAAVTERSVGGRAMERGPGRRWESGSILDANVK